MNRDCVEMLSALSAASARFLVVGAHALAALGAPRPPAVSISGWTPRARTLHGCSKHSAGLAHLCST